MKLVVETLRELLGLFVEDWSLTVGVGAVIAIAGWGLPRFGLDSRWNGAILFLMLAMMLVENVRRSSRK